MFKTRLFLTLLVMALCACGGETDDAIPAVANEPDVVTSDSAADEEALETCPQGQVQNETGSCQTPGIQGCSELFIDPTDGLCKPSLEACPLGQIPLFNEGCQPIGIPDCAPMFIDPEDGHCKPSRDLCPVGQIPKIDTGCQAIGIPDCHPDFLQADTGLCIPNQALCDPGHIAVPSDGCVSLEPPGGCGDGTWGNIEALPGDVYVDAAYVGETSDGTRATPYPSLAQALEVVEEGGRIALAAGEYTDGIAFTESTSVVGRCSSMVSITGIEPSLSGFNAVIQVRAGSESTLRDLTVSGEGVGINVVQKSSVTLERVVIANTVGAGLLAAGAQTVVTGSDVHITGAHPSQDTTYAIAVKVEGGASVTLNRAAITQTTGYGLRLMDPGTTFVGHELAVTETLPMTSGTIGRGVRLSDGASMELTQSVFAKSQGLGMSVYYENSTVTIRDSVIANQPDGDGSFGMEIGGGASVTLERVALRENGTLSLMVSGAGTSVTLDSCAVSDTIPMESGAGGAGIYLKEGASMVVSDSSVAGNRDFGIHSTGTGTSLTLKGSVVEQNTSSQNSDGVWSAFGVSSVEGELTVERSAILSNEGFGVFAHEAGTTVEVLDSVIAHTNMKPDGKFGHGLHIWGGVELTLERVAIVDNQHVGLYLARANTKATVRSVLVSGTRALPDGTEGPGIGLREHAELLLEDSAIVNNHMAAVFVITASATLRRSILSDTIVSEMNLDPEYQYGDGLLARNATIGAEDLYAVGNTRAGFLFDTTDGVVLGNLIQNNGIGLATQGDRVPEVSEVSLVIDNGQNNVKNAALAVPDEAMMTPDL
jgi:hypothetical protein